MFAAVCTFTGTKSRIKLLIFALEQKLKVHWNVIQNTFPLSYSTSKSEQAEKSLVLPINWAKFDFHVEHEPLYGRHSQYGNKVTAMKYNQWGYH